MTHQNEARKTEKSGSLEKKQTKKTFSWYCIKEKKKEKYDSVSKKVHSGRKKLMFLSLSPLEACICLQQDCLNRCLEGNVCLRRTRLNLSHILVVPSRWGAPPAQGLQPIQLKPRENLRVMVCHVLVFPEWPTGWKGLCHRKLTVAPSLWLYSNSNFMCFKLPFCLLPSEV